MFRLSSDASESLANSAGLTLSFLDGDLYEFLKLHHKGKLKDIYEGAFIGERMLRYYKKTAPTKQALIAIAVSIVCSLSEVDVLLRSYGYCLSNRSISDVVVIWYMNNSTSVSRHMLLIEINIVLENIGLPLLMTRQSV